MIRADQLDYNSPTDVAHATGNVQVNRAGNLYSGRSWSWKSMHSKATSNGSHA